MRNIACPNMTMGGEACMFVKNQPSQITSSDWIVIQITQYQINCVYEVVGRSRLTDTTSIKVVLSISIISIL